MKTNCNFFYCLILFFVFNLKIHSQVIYTDIPDATPNASYSLDLNDDGEVDFLFQFGGINGNIGLYCYPQNSNAYSGNYSNGVYLPWALSGSSSICSSLVTWYGSSNPGSMGVNTNSGYWPGAIDNYLALKLVVGSNTYYGWARLDVSDTSSSFTIKDYAYQSTPNACILSGETNLNTSEFTDKIPVTLFPNPIISSGILQLNYPSRNVTITILNTYGQIVMQQTNITTSSVIISREMLASGLYFIKVEEEGKLLAIKKVVFSD